MKVEDVILVASGGATVYLALQWWKAQSTQARAVRVINPASPFFSPGRPTINPKRAPTINDRYPSFDVTSLPPGYTWNDESEAYVKKDSENVPDLLYV